MGDDRRQIGQVLDRKKAINQPVNDYQENLLLVNNSAGERPEHNEFNHV